MINEMMLVGQVVGKIVSGMFFNAEGVIVIGVFALGGLGMYIKSKLEHY